MHDSLIIVVGSGKGDCELAEMCNRHTRAIFFEPLPDIAQWLRERNAESDLEVVEAACGARHSLAAFNIYNRDGLSSSLGRITSQAIDEFSTFDLSLRATIQVEVINLYHWLLSHGIDYVDTLVTDAQGMDLAILQTLRPMLEYGRIGHIQCEADGVGYVSYYGLPSNSELDFMEFMRAFPRYKASRVDGRRLCQPDLVWKYE